MASNLFLLLFPQCGCGDVKLFMNLVFQQGQKTKRTVGLETSWGPFQPELPQGPVILWPSFFKDKARQTFTRAFTRSSAVAPSAILWSRGLWALKVLGWSPSSLKSSSLHQGERSSSDKSSPTKMFACVSSGDSPSVSRGRGYRSEGPNEDLHGTLSSSAAEHSCLLNFWARGRPTNWINQ